MRKSLLEVVKLSPHEQETLGLSAAMRRILPAAQALRKDVLPIKPREDKWTRLKEPERLARLFEFKEPQYVKEFVLELLELQENMHHHAVITVDELAVRVEVWTKTIDAVTELDIEFAKQADQIALDVPFRFGHL